MKYKITMISGKEVEWESDKDLDAIIKESDYSEGIKINKNIWLITKHIVSIEVINER